MFKPDTEEPDQQGSEIRRGGFHWLTDSKRGWILPLSGLWILGLDWILFSSNVLSAGFATPVIVLIGFLLGGAGTFYLQCQVARDSVWNAALKSVLAGVAVGVPWPLAGTLVGGWVLVASGITKRKQ